MINIRCNLIRNDPSRYSANMMVQIHQTTIQDPEQYDITEGKSCMEPTRTVIDTIRYATSNNKSLVVLSPREWRKTAQALRTSSPHTGPRYSRLEKSYSNLPLNSSNFGTWCQYWGLLARITLSIWIPLSMPTHLHVMPLEAPSMWLDSFSTSIILVKSTLKNWAEISQENANISPVYTNLSYCQVSSRDLCKFCKEPFGPR